MTRASEPWGGREWSGDSNFLRQAGVGTCVDGLVHNNIAVKGLEVRVCTSKALLCPLPSLVEFSFDIACSIETGTSSGARSLRL